MKKLLILLTMISLTMSMAFAQDVVENKDTKNLPTKEQIAKQRMQKNIEFEKRLGLTDAQKVLARELRKQAHMNLHPIMMQMYTNRQTAEMVKKSRIAVQVQEERLAVLDAEYKELEKEANKIRKQNMKEFESILTTQQKRILKQMKKEGRKKYHSNHPPKYPVMHSQELKK